MKLLLIVTLLLKSVTSKASAISNLKSFSCITQRCVLPFGACVKNTKCRKAIMCNRKCLESDNAAACNLLCQLTDGYQNTQYVNLLRCMSKNGCLPKLPPDGKCLAKKENGIKELTHLNQLEGTWWILKG